MLLLVELEQANHRRRHAPRRHLHHLAPEGRALAIDAAAEVELILRHRHAADAPHGAVKAERRHVMLAARVGAARDLDVELLARLDRRGRLARRCAERVFDGGGELARAGHGEVAGVGAGARGDVVDGARAGATEAERQELGVQRGQAGLGDEAEHQVLLVREARGAVGELARQLGRAAQLRRGDVAALEPRDDRVVAGLALLDAVRRVEAGEAVLGGRLAHRGAQAQHRVGAHFVGDVDGDGAAAVGVDLGQLGGVLLAKAVHADLADDVLEARARLVLAVAHAVEHAHHRLDDRQEALGRHELLERVRVLRRRRQAAADANFEPAFGIANARQNGDVVDRALRAVVAAAGERDLELARHRLADRVAQEVARDRLSIGRDVEGRAVAHAGQRARGHVAHRRAARLLGGEADLVELGHHFGGARELHEVELHVLARGDVPEAARVLVGDVGEPVELRRGQDPLRDLDADHVDVGLTLTVGAAAEAIDLELVRRHLAALEALQMLDEVVDVGGARKFERLRHRGHGCFVHALSVAVPAGPVKQNST